MKKSGNIPTLSIHADCLPEAWEKAVLAAWDEGPDIKTQYDKHDAFWLAQMPALNTLSEGYTRQLQKRAWATRPPRLRMALDQNAMRNGRLHRQWTPVGNGDVNVGTDL